MSKCFVMILAEANEYFNRNLDKTAPKIVKEFWTSFYLRTMCRLLWSNESIASRSKATQQERHVCSSSGHKLACIPVLVVREIWWRRAALAHSFVWYNVISINLWKKRLYNSVIGIPTVDVRLPEFQRDGVRSYVEWLWTEDFKFPCISVVEQYVKMNWQPRKAFKSFPKSGTEVNEKWNSRKYSLKTRDSIRRRDLKYGFPNGGSRITVGVHLSAEGWSAEFTSFRAYRIFRICDGWLVLTNRWLFNNLRWQNLPTVVIGKLAISPESATIQCRSLAFR
jgi:hypothetical protein